MSLEFNEEEERTSDLLLDFMVQIKDWGLKYNSDEMTRAIHTLQMFVFQHALQRTDGLCGEWYALR